MPLKKTLCCHLLTAWLLKLPLWASDLTHAIHAGELPFLGFRGCVRKLLDDSMAGAAGLFESPRLTHPRTVTKQSQEIAHRIELVLPELNLGAPPSLLLRTFCSAVGGGRHCHCRAPLVLVHLQACS